MLCSLKTLLADLKFCHYFSDDALSQYKNFSNLFYHEKDHGIPAEWYYFATSHRKNPCDGTGETVTCLVFYASLQMNQILNVNKIFDCCQENITGTVFLKNIQSQIMEHIV